MNRKMTLNAGGIMLLISASIAIAMDMPKTRMMIKNNSMFDIAFKFSKKNEFDDIRILPAGKFLILENSPLFFSMKRSGYADQYLSYVNQDLKGMIEALKEDDPYKTWQSTEEGVLPTIIIESSYTDPFGWNVRAEWHTP